MQSVRTPPQIHSILFNVIAFIRIEPSQAGVRSSGRPHRPSRVRNLRRRIHAPEPRPTHHSLRLRLASQHPARRTASGSTQHWQVAAVAHRGPGCHLSSPSQAYTKRGQPYRSELQPADAGHAVWRVSQTPGAGIALPDPRRERAGAAARAAGDPRVQRLREPALCSRRRPGRDTGPVTTAGCTVSSREIAILIKGSEERGHLSPWTLSFPRRGRGSGRKELPRTGRGRAGWDS